MERKVFLPIIMFMEGKSTEFKVGGGIKLESTERGFSKNMNSSNTFAKVNGKMEPVKEVWEGWEGTIWVVVLASGLEIYTDVPTTKGLIHGIAFPKKK